MPISALLTQQQDKGCTVNAQWFTESDFDNCSRLVSINLVRSIADQAANIKHGTWRIGYLHDDDDWLGKQCALLCVFVQHLSNYTLLCILTTELRYVNLWSKDKPHTTQALRKLASDVCQLKNNFPHLTICICLQDTRI